MRHFFEGFTLTETPLHSHTDLTQGAILELEPSMFELPRFGTKLRSIQGGAPLASEEKIDNVAIERQRFLFWLPPHSAITKRKTTNEEKKCFEDDYRICTCSRMFLSSCRARNRSSRRRPNSCARRSCRTWRFYTIVLTGENKEVRREQIVRRVQRQYIERAERLRA